MTAKITIDFECFHRYATSWLRGGFSGYKIKVTNQAPVLWLLRLRLNRSPFNPIVDDPSYQSVEGRWESVAD
jgi:hypothetical protein